MTGAVATDGVARVRDLLDRYPRAAVLAFDAMRNIGDARALLARSGVELLAHTVLRAGALAEFVMPTDVEQVSLAGVDARQHGVGERTLHLRDGRVAALYLVEVGHAHLPTVGIFVPECDDLVAESPVPTAVQAGPRVGVLHCDAFGAISKVEPSAVALLGRAHDELHDQPILGIVHPDDHEEAIVNWVAGKEQRGVALRWRCRVVHRDGSPLWVEATLTNDIDGNGGDVRVEMYDIAKEVAATEALATEKELLGQLTETLPVGVAKFDVSGRIGYANARLGVLLGAEPTSFIERAVRGDVRPRALADAFAALLREGVGFRLVVEQPERHRARHLEWTLRPVRETDGTVAGGVVCVADVTEATELRAALEQRATTDALTECLNRAGTMAAIDAALADACPGEGVALLFVDLDAFKAVNDSHGHAVGDQLLVTVAHRLRTAVRPGDVVGRLGGDEFVVVAPGMPSAEHALEFATRVSAAVHGLVALDGAAVAVAASVGVAWTEDGDADPLLTAADAAMYRAKHERRVTPVLASA